jgi:hypothetical protein
MYRQSPYNNAHAHRPPKVDWLMQGLLAAGDGQRYTALTTGYGDN